MKFEITNRLTGPSIFSIETDSFKLCVEAAVSYGVDLGGSDLRGAELRGANLRDADLRDANLNGEKLKIAPISILNLTWDVLITPAYMRIGCQRHTHEEWAAFTDIQINGMESRAEDFWSANKTWLLAACAAHRAESEAAK